MQTGQPALAQLVAPRAARLIRRLCDRAVGVDRSVYKRGALVSTDKAADGAAVNQAGAATATGTGRRMMRLHVNDGVIRLE
ncbi:hypothetical protein O9K51_01668 [Purpureocillium lavendulum]|uniref:Uncharacterized protein n=1 Tax=Purpureocillium lavendulum TaxID=1247861 RepID=A0AB34G9R4_9HYPO|nr:hypothetical protein O9K51_01668 [Purpureocillium lavendulum]